MNSFNNQTQLNFQRDVYKMVRLQIYNWGTFTDLHDIPISEKGFLFVGPSGAGKSTLLDAFTSLLIPPKWVDFNAAAREAAKSGKDRNLVTYVRGAWGEQKDDETGSITTRYLRPDTTWSGLALTYQSDSGHTVVLSEIFWIKGRSNTVSDVKRRYMVLERPFDLWEVKEFDLDDRKLKRTLPDAFIKEEFSPYCERFRRLLGIDTEIALRLLHKTQSAKNLGDLNDFLRDFMLEKPDTFKAADQLVSEFGELSEAHKSVITARDQISVLNPSRKIYELWNEMDLKSKKAEDLRSGADVYRKFKMLEFIEDEIIDLEESVFTIEGEVQTCKLTLNSHESRIANLHDQFRNSGGDIIERLNNQRERFELERIERNRKATQLAESCQQLMIDSPNEIETFKAIVQRSKDLITRLHSSEEYLDEKKFNVKTELMNLTTEFTSTSSEIKSLKSRPSNIPFEWLNFREEILKELGIPEISLPFIGELIEVKEDELEWQGSIERMLRGFALSLLVEEKHYSTLSSFLNSIDLGRKVIYYRVFDIQKLDRSHKPHSMLNKIKIKDCRFKAWLENELNQRYDYVCAASLRVFQNEDYAMTKEGQVKRGKSRHEKDDQFTITDKRKWVLGFNNQTKLQVYTSHAQVLASKISELQLEHDKLIDDAKTISRNAIHAQVIVNFQWHEVDVASKVLEIEKLDKSIKEAKENNKDLVHIEKNISEEKARKDLVEASYRELRISLDKLKDKKNGICIKRDQLKNDCNKLVLSEDLRHELEEKIQINSDTLTLENVEEQVRHLVKTLTADKELSSKERDRAEKEVEKRFADFQRRWPTEAANVDASIDSAEDFFVKLVRLETDNLPAFEERFFDLLRNQSHQNLAALSTYLQQARKEITDKLELVNHGLSMAPFNPGTTLKINATDRQLPEVKDFKQKLQTVLSNAWTNDRELAEEKFEVMKELVSQLNGQEAQDKRWRDLVLDVRLHVEFMASEATGDGVVVEVYRGGSGKSGGQRQKLATTCLAAALKYQLGGFDSGCPAYSPVILDEAFDKADPDFTTLAMNIFKSFGFQMIVATPLKSVMTLEPFIGGACVVGIKDRKYSGVTLIEYDKQDSRLKLSIDEGA